MRPATIAAVIVATAVALSIAVHPSDSHARSMRPPAVTHRYTYPLKLSASRRYLVDQRNTPFLIVGDSPQSLIGNLTLKTAALYIDDRKAAGFNSLWVDLLCVKYTGCRSDGSTVDGIKPFTKSDDLSTPNPEYFGRARAVVKLAAKAGIVIFLDPIETGGWLSVLRANGIAKDYAYGRFIGKGFAGYTNIVWASGNDFQSWSNPTDDADVLAVARGIRSVEPNRLQTTELNYPRSASLDDARWRPLIGLDAAYTYFPTYAEVLKEYNRKSFLPVYTAEAGYEFEQNLPSISKGNPPTLRRQEYWSMLSGAAGQFYGNHYTWQFTDSWLDHLDTTGSTQVGYLARLFESLRWFRLVPDQTHKIVTAGYGKFAVAGSVDASDYVTTAVTSDGKLVVSYLPNGGTITVHMARFTRPMKGRWYDPTRGTYVAASGSPFPDSGSVRLTPPGSNAEGDPDWVLVLTAR
jgi:hypothetical protein